MTGMKTQDARSLPAKAQEALRLRVVNSVRDGLTQTEAARLFGVARGTVNRTAGAHAAAIQNCASTTVVRRRKVPRL